MIFADKLIQLRRRKGWSQEELAKEMNVTRQSVSKWEGAQSTPDLEKMIRLSELFGVSVDYLCKDNIEEAECFNAAEDTVQRRVSTEEATAFLSAKAVTAKRSACAVFLCILSPICLLLLGAMSESPNYGITDNMAAGAGMVVLLIFVTAAVAIFITSGSKTAAFGYLEREVFEAEPGVSEMVKERKAQYQNNYTKNKVLGICICIASLILLFGGMIIDQENALFLTGMLCAAIAVAGVGVFLLVRNGIVWAGFEKLLQEGDYSQAKKERQPVLTAVSVAHWLAATAIYLAYSFATDDWKRSWIVWAAAGVLYPAVIGILNACMHRKRKE